MLILIRQFSRLLIQIWSTQLTGISPSYTDNALTLSRSSIPCMFILMLSISGDSEINLESDVGAGLKITFTILYLVLLVARLNLMR